MFTNRQNKSKMAQSLLERLSRATNTLSLSLTFSSNKFSDPKVAQTIAICEKECKILRKAGFSDEDYCSCPLFSLLPTVEEDERKKGVGGRREKEKEILDHLLSNNALLALERKKESPFEINSLDAVEEYLTHLAIWKHIVKNQLDNVLIICANRFATTSKAFLADVNRILARAVGDKEFDILFLSAQNAFLGNRGALQGAGRGSDTTLLQYNSENCKYLDTSAYVLSCKGAQKLLHRALPIEARVGTFLFAVAEIEQNSLISRPFLAEVAAAGSNSIENLSLSLPRTSLMYAVVGLAMLSLLLLVCSIFFFYKWKSSRVEKTKEVDKTKEKREKKKKEEKKGNERKKEEIYTE